MANLDTRNKRASALGVNLAAPRLEANPDGTIAQLDRQIAALVYGGITASAAANLNTRNKRGSAINMDRPAGRLYANPDGTIGQADRQQAGLKYAGILADAPGSPPPTGNLDTRAKRASAIGIDRPSWRVWPLADGTFNQADRQQMSYKYAGILAAAPGGGPSGGAFWIFGDAVLT